MNAANLQHVHGGIVMDKVTGEPVDIARLMIENEALKAEINRLKAAKQSVKVKGWDDYHHGEDMGNPLNFQIDVDDQRESSGQLYIDVGSVEGEVNDFMGVTIEINKNPIDGSHVPCAHIHFDGSNMAVSLFKVGNKILVRPETDVDINPFLHKDGSSLDVMHWIE